MFPDETTAPILLVDPYRDNRVTGSFILIGEDTNFTAGLALALPS